MTKKTRKTLLIGSALLLLLILASLYTVLIKPQSQKAHYNYEETQVHRGDLDVEVTESGVLTYETKDRTYDIDINEISDEEDEEEESEELSQRYLTVKEMHAVRGMQFVKGDVLMSFTADSVEAVRRLLQSALADASADYNDAEKEYNLSVLEAKTTLEKQQIAQKYAARIRNGKAENITNDIDSIQYEIQNRQLQKDSLQESVDSAYEDYVEAQTNYVASKEYYESLTEGSSESVINYMTSYLNDKNDYERALETYENAIEAQKKNANEIKTLTSNLAIAKAEQTIEKLEVEEDYQKASLYGEYAEMLYQASVEELREELREAEEKKKTCEKKLSEFEKLVGTDGVLYAEEDGIITNADYEVGDELETTGTLFSYATADNLTITIDVTEEDVVYLSVGDEVQVLFGAYPEEPYKGRITAINTTATSAETPTVSYEVEILVKGSLRKLYGGMTAKITFITRRSEDTLYIDRRALVEENGFYYVYRKTGLSGKEKIPVTVGIKNESYVEILTGVDVEDTVYIPTLIGGNSNE